MKQVCYEVVESKQESRLEYYLRLWADYMRSSGVRKMWYPSKSAGFSSQSSRAWDALEEVIDDSVTDYEVNVMIGAMDSLPKLQRISIEFEYINKRAGAHVFSHPLLPRDWSERVQLLDQAKSNLEKIIQRKGLYL